MISKFSGGKSSFLRPGQITNGMVRRLIQQLGKGYYQRIYVVYCDAAVQSTEEFGPSEPIRLSPKGGGGTDFRPPFQWVEEEGIQPKCLIYLTDLCCNSFPERPGYPVLWVTDSRTTAPFGETLRIDAD